MTDMLVNEVRAWCKNIKSKRVLSTKNCECNHPSAIVILLVWQHHNYSVFLLNQREFFGFLYQLVSEMRWSTICVVRDLV